MKQTREEAIRQAYRKLFDRVWDWVDSQVAEQYGLPLPTSEALRTQAERHFLSEGGHKHLDPRRTSGARLLSSAFAPLALETARAQAADFMHKARRLDDCQWRKYVRTPKPKVRRERAACYRKADARNLDLAWFVVERVIPFGQLLGDPPGSLRPGHRGPKVAVPWRALAGEWNRLRPRRQFAKDTALSRAYYRATRKEHIEHDLRAQLTEARQRARMRVDRAAREIAARGPLWRRRQAARLSAELMLGAPPAQRAQAPQWPEGFTEFIRRSREEQTQAYRDRLTLQDLVDARLPAFLRSQMGSRERQDPVEKWPSETPLRPWFLPEVEHLNWYLTYSQQVFGEARRSPVPLARPRLPEPHGQSSQGHARRFARRVLTGQW